MFVERTSIFCLKIIKRKYCTIFWLAFFLCVCVALYALLTWVQIKSTVQIKFQISMHTEFWFSSKMDKNYLNCSCFFLTACNIGLDCIWCGCWRRGREATQQKYQDNYKPPQLSFCVSLIAFYSFHGTMSWVEQSWTNNTHFHCYYYYQYYQHHVCLHLMMKVYSVAFIVIIVVYCQCKHFNEIHVHFPSAHKHKRKHHWFPPFRFLHQKHITL